MKTLIKAFCAALAAILALSQPAQAAELFKQLDGSWRGTGVVRLQGGNERIVCRGYYNVKSGGASISLAIRCASPSYRIEMRGGVTDNGGRLTGQWEERTFNAEGALSGRVSGSSINLAISGVITGTLAITLNGSSHSVNLTASGPQFRGVSISLTKG